MVTSMFSSFNNFLHQFGILDFVLPFFLVFTIVFAVMQKVKLLGTRKSYHVVIALVIALLFVMPHIGGWYPLGFDPVQVMNETLPSIALVAVAAIMLLLLMGVFGTDFSKSAAPIIAIVSIIFVAYIFGSSLHVWDGPSEIFSWWSDEVTEVIIILIVFGVIVYFITKEPSEKSAGGEIAKSIGKLFERK